MPLRLCRVDDADSYSPDAYVALTGGYCVGTFNRLRQGYTEGGWSWGVSFGHLIDDSGMVGTAREAKNAVAAAFRRQLTRIGLAEVEGSRLPLRAHEPALAAEPHWDVPPNERSFDRERPRGFAYPRIARIRSGDLAVGVLREVGNAPLAGHWTWAVSGTRHNPPGFIWNGCTPSLEESQDALLRAWSAWIAWAGLRQVRVPEMTRPIRSLC